MTSEDGWLVKEAAPTAKPLPIEAERVIAEAATLTREQILRLDDAEREDATARLVAWDLLRDRLQYPTILAMRFDARERAWAAVNVSLSALACDPLPGDDYWRVATGFGWGAARAARFAACSLVAPDQLEDEVVELLMRPWLARSGPI